jgi:hypothetical protein
MTTGGRIGDGYEWIGFDVSPRSSSFCFSACNLLEFG